MDEADLPFVDETRLKVEPTMANVLGYPGFWQRDPAFGLDWVKTVHGEHAVRIHKPLPSEGHVVGTSRIVDLVDKGEGRGALIFVEREITDQASGELLATVQPDGVLPRRRRLRRPGQGAARAASRFPSARPTRTSTCRHRRRRRWSIGSRATTTRCIRTRPPRAPPASSGRSCTAWRPSA